MIESNVQSNVRVDWSKVSPGDFIDGTAFVLSNTPSRTGYEYGIREVIFLMDGVVYRSRCDPLDKRHTLQTIMTYRHVIKHDNISSY